MHSIVIVFLLSMVRVFHPKQSNFQLCAPFLFAAVLQSVSHLPHVFSPLRPAWLPCTPTNEQPPNKHVTQIPKLNWAKKNRVKSHKSITNLPLVAKQKVRRHGKFGARTNAPRLESIGTNIPASRKPCSTLLSTKNTYVEQEMKPENV